jgi:hypothetical protein
LILTLSEIEPSSDVFAVKLFDIQQHHVLLYGEDYFKTLSFDKNHLKFIAEQELRNQLARMKYFYIQHFGVYEQLLDKVRKGITTLLINANTFLYLKGSGYFRTRQDIMNQLRKEPLMNQNILTSLLEVKNGNPGLSSESILQAYDHLMLQYKDLIKLFKQVHTHG